MNLILLDITLQTITNTKLKKLDGKPFFQPLPEFPVKAADDYRLTGQRSGRGCEPVASCEVVARQHIRGYLLDSGTYLLK